MDPEQIEMQLWEFIDGTCTDAERQRISLLLTTNEEWKAKYAELTTLHQHISEIDPEQPSVRFSQNVMDTVATERPALATGKYLNKFIVGGIGAFFILSIVFMIAFAFLAGGSQNSHAYTHLNLTTGFSQTFLSIFIMINILIGLVLVDTLLRRKLKH